MEAVEFAPMKRGELRQLGAASGRQIDSHKAAIVRHRRLPHEICFHRPVDQSHDCVMSFLQEFPQLGNCRPSSSCESGDAQHQLVLLRSHACISRRSFAKTQKLPQTVAELRKLVHRPRTRSSLQFQC